MGALLLVGCTSDDPGPPAVDEEGAYTAIVRWAASTVSPPVEGDDRPVVYVMSLDGGTIEPGVQAEVARATVDDIDVRFADEREQAIDLDDPAEPVHDDGVLLLVGPLPDPAATVEVDVDVYFSAERTDPYRLILSASESGATVTQAEVREAG